MNHYSVSDLYEQRYVKLTGRVPKAEPGRLEWSGSSLELRISAGELWVDVTSEYQICEPWLAVIIDGALYQRRSVTRDETRICIFRGLNPNTEKRVRIIRETQSMPEDPDLKFVIREIETDENAVFHMVPDRSIHLEIIGDSITSGEGCLGNHHLQDWVPMCFSHVNSYPFLLAESLNADVQVVSHSGWGVLSSWDGDRTRAIPLIYDADEGDVLPYQPDYVIVNLGTNDETAMRDSPDPEAYRRDFQLAVTEFLKKIRAIHPNAQIIWAYGMLGHAMQNDIQKGIRAFQAQSTDTEPGVRFLLLPDTAEQEMESRSHPGQAAHQRDADQLKEKIMDMEYERGIVRCGSTKRLHQFFQKAEEGNELTVGFLGGSITQGAAASSDTSCYAHLVYQKLADAYPDSSFTYVNAGIGSTTSEYGVSRVEQDLLSYHPDLVFVEFSVNDSCSSFFRETYEGLLRKIVFDDHQPAVVLIHNMRYDTGISAEEIHSEVGAWMNLPAVSLKRFLYPAIESGSIDWHTLSEDGLHPNDRGHKILAELVTHALTKMRKTPTDQQAIEPVLPLTENRFEHLTRLQNRNCSPNLKGFSADSSKQNGVRDCFKNGWYAWNEGDTFTLKSRFRYLSVVYRKTVCHPAQKARLVIDHDIEHAVILDADYEETWGDLICVENIADHQTFEGTESVEHTVEIEIISAPDGAVLPFYLAALLISD